MITEKMRTCEHEGIDVCGHGAGIAECPGCGGHVDLMDAGRGEIGIDEETGKWVTLDEPGAPLDSVKCSMMRGHAVHFPNGSQKKG